MPLPKEPGGPNRRRMTLRNRAELRDREHLERRRELQAAANTAAAAGLDLGDNLDRLITEAGSPPPVCYVHTAVAAARLAATLAAERSAEQRENVAQACAVLAEALGVVEKYHESAGFWEARTQVKRWFHPHTGELVEERSYGPYFYRRYLDAEGRQQVEYHGKKLPPDAPAMEDMRQTYSTCNLVALLL